MLVLVYGVLCLCLHVFAAERNSICITPNGEESKCIAVKSCKVILDAIATYNRTAIDFAKQSQCGYDTEPLVCCGSTSYPKPTSTDISTEQSPSPYPPPSPSPYPPPSPSPSPKSPPIKPVLRTHRGGALPDRSICGLERDSDRIIGGNIAALDEFPWMVLLRYNDKFGDDAGFKCGGTVINNRYVLTAAHCISGKVKLEFDLASVRLGEWDYNLDNDCVMHLANRECADPVIDMKIGEIIPHPYYYPLTANNDIALLRMEEPVEYSDFIRPICLPPEKTAPPPLGKYLTVSGWGVKGQDEPLSSVKLRVDVPIVNNTICEKNAKKKVSANQICAGGEKGKDSCSGDSGGPLMAFYGDSVGDHKQWYQEGVVSRGLLACGTEGYPAIYARTARYLNWIANNIRD